MADVGAVWRSLVEERDELRTQLTQAQVEIAALREVVEAADRMHQALDNIWTDDGLTSRESETVVAFDAARAKLSAQVKPGNEGDKGEPG